MVSVDVKPQQPVSLAAACYTVVSFAAYFSSARLVDLVLEGVKKTEEEEDRGHLVRRQLQTTILKDISKANVGEESR